MFAADPLMQPYMQYGAFGLCFVLLGMLGWGMRTVVALFRDVVQALRETSRVIEANTKTIDSIGDGQARHEQTASERHKESQTAFWALRDTVIDRLAEKAKEAT